MCIRFCLLVCCFTLMGCASEGQAVRGAGAPVEEVARDIRPGTVVLVYWVPEAEHIEVPSVFLPVEMPEWEQWDEEALEAAGWNILFVEGKPEGMVEPVMARRPLRTGGRGGLGGRTHDQVITQEFRRQWGYGQGQPRPERLQQILFEVYSRYPIPQLIGISP